MRLVTYSTASQPAARLGVRVGHRVLDVESASRVDGEPLPPSMTALLREGRGAVSRVQALAKAAQSSAGRYSAAMLEERAIRLMPPVPDARRYLEAHSGREAPGVRDVGPVRGHDATIDLAGSDRTRAVASPVFVIGRETEAFAAGDDALDRVIGITLQIRLGDGDSPAILMGPELVTLGELDPDDLWVSYVVNGAAATRFGTGGLVAQLEQALEAATRGAPLEAGDLVAVEVGAAPGVDVRRGDEVECAIEGVMTLRATLAA